jgi:hypothetical protein
MIFRDRIFYVALFCSVILNSFLLSKPNLLGKIGLLIYKYHYLRSYPRTLLTVSCVISVALIVCWAIEFFTVRGKISKKTATIILAVFLVISALLLFQTINEFTAWSYSHIGRKFRYGAYMLPSLLIMVFTYFIVDIRLSVTSAPAKVEVVESQNQTKADVDH